MPCGFDIDRTRREMAALTDRADWAAAARRADGPCLSHRRQSVFQSPRPRIAESLEILAEVLHPQRFDFGHHGRGWIKL